MLLPLVEIDKRPRDRIALLVRIFAHGPKKPASDDCESLFRSRGMPGGFQPANDVAESVEGFSAANATLLPHRRPGCAVTRPCRMPED